MHLNLDLAAAHSNYLSLCLSLFPWWVNCRPPAASPFPAALAFLWAPSPPLRLFFGWLA